MSPPQEGIATLSSFERYKKELLAGQLTWAPMHESGAHGARLGIAAARMSALCRCAMPAAVVLTGKQCVACVHRIAGILCVDVLLLLLHILCLVSLPCRRFLAGERRKAGGEQLPAAARAAQAAGDEQVGAMLWAGEVLHNTSFARSVGWQGCMQTASFGAVCTDGHDCYRNQGCFVSY